MTPTHDPQFVLGEAIALAVGLLELQGERFRKQTTREAAAIVEIASEYVMTRHRFYCARLCEVAHTQPDVYLLIMALERDNFHCQRCGSAAVRIPQRLVSHPTGRDDYVSLCAACRDAWRALDAAGKERAARVFAKKNERRKK